MREGAREPSLDGTNLLGAQAVARCLCSFQVVRQENLCLPRGERLDTVLVACVMPLALRDKCARAARWGQEDMFRDAPLSARAKLLAHAQMGEGGGRACACALSARVSEAEGV